MISDESADRILQLATAGRPPAEIAAELGIAVATVWRAIDEPVRGTCPDCLLRTRTSDDGRCRWHPSRPGERERCPGVGRKAIRIAGRMRVHEGKHGRARMREEDT